MKLGASITLFLLTLFSFSTSAQRINVDVNLNVNHVLGEVTELDREKFITLHADITERDWFEADNLLPNVADDFLNKYDVYLGRNTGGIQWVMNSVVNEDPTRPGFADTIHLASLGSTRKANYGNSSNWHPFEARNTKVLCPQLHPFYPDGQRTNNGWAFSQTATEQEPFGTASGEFYAHYIKQFYGQGGNTGEPIPNFFEVANEPLWELSDEIDEAFEFHNTVAREIKKVNPAVKVAGYCTAFPNFEENNFQRWEQRWKKFMDESGASMDLWSIHLYDFPSISQGQKRLRRGSNVEATLDMMEQYSMLKFNEVKPFLITEYGASSHDYAGAWSGYRDYLHNTAANALAMQFMERSNNVALAINYTMLKAKWGSPNVNSTWSARLLRQQGEPNSFSGKWMYSDRIHFYELWADVNGKRVDAKSEHLDVMTDAYIAGDKAYIVLNNLAWEDKEFKINLYGLVDEAPASLMVKHYHLADDSPVFDRNPGVIDTAHYAGADIPSSFTIQAEGTMVLAYTLSTALSPIITSTEKKYYATEYLKPITANNTLRFDLEDVLTDAPTGEAMLRLGIGRPHGRSLLPVVRVNGTQVDVPTDFRGDAQTDRSTFFGVIEVEVPYDLLQTNNTVTITFPDGSGHVSSVTLQVFEFSGEVRRFNDFPTSTTAASNTLGLEVHPNPASENVSFYLESGNAYQLKVLNTLGQRVFEQDCEGVQKIDVSEWTKGVYYYVVGSRGTKLSGAFVVQ